MKAYYIFQQADEETISNILDWMRNQERAIYRAAVRELGALKKLRPEFIQRKPLQEQFSFIKKCCHGNPAMKSVTICFRSGCCANTRTC